MAAGCALRGINRAVRKCITARGTRLIESNLLFFVPELGYCSGRESSVGTSWTQSLDSVPNDETGAANENGSQNGPALGRGEALRRRQY